jgi:hypothetical protein
MPFCKFGDPSCPCQDGDMCHYEGPKAWPSPRREQDHIKAFATVTHAIVYIGEDEPLTIGTLQVARRAIYEEKLVFTRYAQWTHFCEKCPRYRDAKRD